MLVVLAAYDGGSQYMYSSSSSLAFRAATTVLSHFLTAWNGNTLWVRRSLGRARASMRLVVCRCIVGGPLERPAHVRLVGHEGREVGWRGDKVDEDIDIGYREHEDAR
jgi:hypothetical protein